MKNHKEMFEALLAGETLKDRNGFNLYMLDNELILENSNGGRHNIETLSLRFPDNWKVKQKTININGFEVPEPLREIPELGKDGVEGSVYVVSLSEGLSCRIWGLQAVLGAFLELGLCHKTKEAAELHAKALLSFTKKE